MRVVSDISLMEGGNLGVGARKGGGGLGGGGKEGGGGRWAVVGFIMSQHTQLPLPSHLNERRGERGTFFAVFAQLKANARAHGDTNPV